MNQQAESLSAQLDFATDNAVTGFRLQRFELLNWGTFDRHVWRIEPAGHNALLTGDIGSGKSTLVDAVTTLLVPHHRITYNKAAGAHGRERSLYSYVRGEFKSEQDAVTQTSRAVALRNEKNYTVLLAWFHNSGFDQGATLAQVFWLKEGQRNPERFFIFAEVELTIAEHFSQFDTIPELRQRLRKTPGVTLLDSFKDYATRFRRYFGIQQDKALELFYQTVSMKSVDNLTEFVRQHMLEQSDVSSRIDELKRAFDNLNRAHESILKARAQISQLKPLISNAAQHDKVVAESAELTACREALAFWFAEHAVALNRSLLSRLADKRAVVQQRLEKRRQLITSLRMAADSLKAGIEDSGGSRLRVIDQECERLQAERQRCQLIQQKYAKHCAALELPETANIETFSENQRLTKGLLDALQQQDSQFQQRRTDLAVVLRNHKDQGEELEQELQSLRSRRSNIPRLSLQIRARMASDLGIDEDELPFAGELLQVDDAEIRWQGAIERVLHSFGLSLLVSEAHYAAVSRYVNQTALRGRLVYYKTHHQSMKASPHTAEPNALYRKLLIKSDSLFYAWLEAWLRSHFDHACCEALSEFRHLPKALTLQGQIKSGGKRHEKDDRHSLLDQSRYVLGWSNELKIAALEQNLKNISTEIIAVAQRSKALVSELDGLTQRRDHSRDLLNIDHFSELDWQTPAREIATLQDEKRQIEGSSDTLKQLREQLHGTQQRIADTELKKTTDERDDARLEIQARQAEEAQETAHELADSWHRAANESVRQRLSSRLQNLYQGAELGSPPSLKNLDLQQRKLRESIQAQIDKFESRRKRLNDKLIAAMQAYKTDYPVETQEVDAAISALVEFGSMLSELQSEDLPRHEARFREMLREETIQGVALFRAQLEREQKQISDKIETINTSLYEIEYNPGTYIRLVQDRAQDTEVREFQQDMKQLLSGSLDEDELYTEAKFLQVKTIIDRFNGREGFADQDRRWAQKVTDVRNWFLFSASERWREDDREREFYSDTAGKSGGQKEKLAYTILASALAYQFGLEWGSVRSRSFRFVVIDEAFGRGSDESTRYALELFRKLNLQLLIVTPLQKIHIIEDYINAVHYVHNEGGKASVLSNLTIEEYRARKQAFHSAE